LRTLKKIINTSELHIQDLALQTNVKSIYLVSVCLVILFFQNIIIFWNHYFDKMGFVADFSLAYHARPAFFITSISNGIFPQWIPFQSMGYPLMINAQTGLFYPAFWVFIITGIQYTLDAAVVMQVIHVFIGSVGMFFFLNFVIRSRKYALVGAIAFQFFSGFYFQAPYPDIIRAYALTPWIFYLITLNIEKPTLHRKILFIPMAVYFIATGGYPLSFISITFMMFLFVILQTANYFFNHKINLRFLIIFGSLGGLLVLGLAFSTIHLGPFLGYSDELTRFDDDLELRDKPLNFEDLERIFVPIDLYKGHGINHAHYILIPILIFATLIPYSYIRKYWIFFVILFVGLLMSFHEQTFFAPTIIDIFPILGLGRFHIVAYSLFIVIPVIIFAISGLKSIIETKYTKRQLIIRFSIIASLFFYSLFSIYSDDILHPHSIISVIIFVACISMILIWQSKRNLILSKKITTYTVVFLITFTIIISIDGFRFINDIQYWKLNQVDEYYTGLGLPWQKNGNLASNEIFKNLPTERPERNYAKDKKSDYRDPKWLEGYEPKFRGYLDGSYQMNDKGGTVMHRAKTAIHTPQYSSFMLMKWTPIMLDYSHEETATGIIRPSFLQYYLADPVTGATQNATFFLDSDNAQVTLPHYLFRDLKTKPIDNSVIQTHYGINKINYKVSLEEPKLMVENEMFFPGWTATLIFQEKQVELNAIQVNDVFRAWALPEGDYIMTAVFNFPNLEIYQSVSIVSFLLWITIMAVFWRRLKS